MLRQSHNIQCQSIEIEFEDLDDAMGVQNRIAEVFYEKVQPRMEVLLDELFGKKYYASLDKLEIDCGLLNKKNWEQEFAEEAIRKLKEELVQVNKKEADLREVEEITATETFFFFLENGFLPWNRRIDSISELEQSLNINEKLIVKLKTLINRKEKVAERLTIQFSKKFTSEIIAVITKEKKKETDEILNLLEKLISLKIDQHIVDAAILTVFSSEEKWNRKHLLYTFLLSKVKGTAELTTEIRELVKNLPVNEGKRKASTEKNDQELKTEKKNEQEKGGKKDKEENEKPYEAIYISNAGLILLHPFLITLFEHVKLTEENRWIDEPSQHKAVLILEFLSTGIDRFEEFNLMLNKILCGIDMDETVATDMQLDEEIKNECEGLLNNVITHWSILKNTTIDGLRETFLQRSGKLSKIDNGWLLQVEQKPVDVLLNHLPWGIGIIKLPWMDNMLFVEWT